MIELSTIIKNLTIGKCDTSDPYLRCFQNDSFSKVELNNGSILLVGHVVDGLSPISFIACQQNE